MNFMVAAVYFSLPYSTNIRRESEITGLLDKVGNEPVRDFHQIIVN